MWRKRRQLEVLRWLFPRELLLYNRCSLGCLLELIAVGTWQGLGCYILLFDVVKQTQVFHLVQALGLGDQQPWRPVPSVPGWHHKTPPCFTKLVGMDGFHKGTGELVSVIGRVIIEVEIVSGANWAKEGFPSRDGPLIFFRCARHNCCWLGSFCRRDKAHKCISFGRLKRTKPVGVCSENRESREEANSELEECWSLERASATLFESPGDHWEYMQVDDSIINPANFLAIIILIEDSLGDVLCKKKRFFQPPCCWSTIGLWKIHSKGWMYLSLMSIYMDIIEVMNSNVLIWAHPTQLGGSFSLQVLPE